MNDPVYVAFLGSELLARGPLQETVRLLHPSAASQQGQLRIFDEGSGRAVDFDWRGDAAEVEARARAQLAGKTRGRPKLGVESREVTLLPRHWAWLDAQGGGASAALRRIIDQQSRQANGDAGQVDALYRLTSGLCGDLPHFEEATRALYREQWEEAERIFLGWPGEIGAYLAERLRAIVRAG